MKSAASYFSISFPLIKENLRRFWALPALSFLAYFLSGIFPLLLSYNRLYPGGSQSRYDYYFISQLLNNQYAFFMILHLIVPIIAAVIVFRYLQTSASVTSIHSMPFTRAQLYNSNILSGLILTLTPIILTGILLLIMAQPTYNPYIGGMDLLSDGVENIDVFSRLEVLQWIWESFIILLFIYVIAVFAGMVTGNSIMHLALGFGFNFLIAGLLGVFSLYADQYLYGFSMNSGWAEFILATSPYLNIILNGSFSVTAQVMYLLSSLMLLALSMILYYRRKLERATDSLVFGFMIPIITYLIAFFGMVLIGLYFEVMGNDEVYLYAGLFSGALIFFIIGRMIVKKTPRVFNLQSAKSFGIYMILAVLFTTSFTLDLFGFENRIPDQRRIQSASINTSRFLPPYGGWNPISYSNTGKEESLPLTTPENIEAVRAFHRSILQQRDSEEGYYYSWVQIDYALGGWLNPHRSYTLNYMLLKESKELAQIFESDEYKARYAPANMELARISSMDVSDVNGLNQQQTISSKKQIEEFVACLDADFRDQSYADAISLQRDYANVTVNYRDPGERTDRYYSITVGAGSKRSIAWLRENGYTQMEVTPDMVDRILFYKERPTTYEIDLSHQYQYTTDSKTSEKRQYIEITDKEQIKQILDTYETTSVSERFYSGRIIFTPDFSSEYTPEISCYYDESTVPSFIREGLDAVNPAEGL